MLNLQMTENDPKRSCVGKAPAWQAPPPTSKQKRGPMAVQMGWWTFRAEGPPWIVCLVSIARMIFLLLALHLATKPLIRDLEDKAMGRLFHE
jgi:hypothetical protein